MTLKQKQKRKEIEEELDNIQLLQERMYQFLGYYDQELTLRYNNLKKQLKELK